MVKQVASATILVVCFLAVTSRIANAQSRDRIQVAIPFAFVLRERMLPAGEYTVERADPARPNVLTLTNREKGVVRSILVQRVEQNNPSTAASLVFIQREGKLYLFQVWNAGAMNGAQVPPGPNMEKRNGGRESLSLVTLKLEPH